MGGTEPVKTLLRRGIRPLPMPPARFRLGCLALAGSLAAMIAGLVAAPSAPASAASAMSVTVASNPNPVATGQAMAYTITAANTGGADASSLPLTDTITSLVPAAPQTAPFFTQSTRSCSYDATTSKGTSTPPSLPAGP